eukprot:c7178_g1_i1 orf=1-327(-)
MVMPSLVMPTLQHLRTGKCVMVLSNITPGLDGRDRPGWVVGWCRSAGWKGVGQRRREPIVQGREAHAEACYPHAPPCPCPCPSSPFAQAGSSVFGTKVAQLQPSLSLSL